MLDSYLYWKEASHSKDVTKVCEKWGVQKRDACPAFELLLVEIDAFRFANDFLLPSTFAPGGMAVSSSTFTSTSKRTLAFAFFSSSTSVSVSNGEGGNLTVSR